MDRAERLITDKEGREQYAVPASMILASAMLITNSGYPAGVKKPEADLNVYGKYEKKLVMTGHDKKVNRKNQAPWETEGLERF